MIPNEFKILRLQRLVQLTLIVFLIMFPIMSPALSASKPECNNKNVKLKTFYSTAAKGFLAVVNNNITIVNDRLHSLYTINAEKSPQFYIFDPSASRFICASKRQRFVTKAIPEPSHMCLFNDGIDEEKSDQIKLMVKNNTLTVTKKGQKIPNKRRRHYKKFQYFIAMCVESTASSDVPSLCSRLPLKKKRFAKFKKLANCHV